MHPFVQMIKNTLPPNIPSCCPSITFSSMRYIEQLKSFKKKRKRSPGLKKTKENENT